MSETTPPTLEQAASGRAKCRGCGERIARGELRLGEHLPNPFSERSPMTLWFHPRCAAFKRPEVLVELARTAAELPDREELLELAGRGLEHPRLARVDGCSRAPTGRAKCRNCREAIDRGTWRVSLVYYEDGRFEPAGFVHAGCCRAYFGTDELADRIAHFARERTPDELAEIVGAIGGR